MMVHERAAWVSETSPVRSIQRWRQQVGSRWLLRKDGPAASNIWEVGGLARGEASDPLPTIHYHLAPMLITEQEAGFRLEHAFTLYIAQTRQKSKGTAALASTDVDEPPLIDFRFLSEHDDLVEIRADIKATRKIVAQRTPPCATHCER